MAEAIDVFEKYQGPIDWHAVAAANVSMAYIKISNGEIPANPPGDHYVLGCHAAGILPGGYAYALGGDPLRQAAVFASELHRLGLAGRAAHGVVLAPMLDFEDASLPIDPASRRRWIIDFADQLHLLVPEAHTQLLYSSANELNQIGPADVPGVRLLPWDAEWGPNDGSNHPITAYHGTAAIHQYTSRGHVPGVPGLVDRDQVLTDITEDNTTTPPPIPNGTYLKIGSRGPAVTILQHTLNTNYPAYSHLAEDGNYGPLTAGVVREFQQRDHLQVDGIAGPQTLHALGLQ